MVRKMLLLSASMALAVMVVGSVALAADIQCDSNPCLGTDENDDIVGTDSAEEIRALDGDDFIDGLDGDDTLHGDPGSDNRLFTGQGPGGIAGGNGDDTSFGGPGDDFLTDYDDTGRNNCGGFCTGRDTQRGGEGADILEGILERDFLYGGQGSDTMSGGAGNDRMSGNRGRDSIRGEEGSDRLRGQRGNDFIDATDFETPGSRDTVGCGRGRDEVLANRNDVVNRENCERVIREPNPTVAPTSEDRDSLREKALKEFVANNKP